MRLFIAALAALAFLCLEGWGGLTAKAQVTIIHVEPWAEPTVVIDNSDSLGAGFHIGGGYVVTAGHMVERERDVTVLSSDGIPRDGHVVLYDGINDIAILSVPEYGDLLSLSLACRDPVVGEPVVARGHPGGVSFVSKWGHVAGVARDRNLLPIDMAITPGMSGGPLIDADGEVIAVAVATDIMQTVKKAPSGGLMAVDILVVSWAVPSSIVCQARDMLGLS